MPALPQLKYAPEGHEPKRLALCVRGHIACPKRMTQRLLDGPLGCRSVGNVSSLEAATTEAVAVTVEEARTFVQAQSSAALDETAAEGRQRAWLWVAATTWVTVFLVPRLEAARSRGNCWTRRLMASWCQIAGAPNLVSGAVASTVLAHLLRDIEAMIERGGRSQRSRGAEAPGAEDVPLVASRPRWDPQPSTLPELYEPRAPGSRAAAGKRDHVGGAENRRHVPEILKLRQAL